MTPNATPNALPTTPQPAPRPRPDPLDSLPTGPRPRIAYATGGAIVHPDGRREVLPGQRRIGITEFARFRDGWVVADERVFEGTVGLAYVAGGRREDLGPCASRGATLSDDGASAAWVTQFCPESGFAAPTLVHVAPVTGDSGVAHEISRTAIAAAVGFVGDEVVVSGFDRRVELVGTDGSVRPMPHLRHATDAHGGLVAGLLPGGDSFGAVVDASTGRLWWKRRGIYPEAFSPDGSLLVGRSGRRTAILDADTGRVVALAQAPRLTLDNLTWEDDEHLVASATFRDRSAILRLDLTGHVTRVGRVVPIEPWGIAFEEQP